MTQTVWAKALFVVIGLAVMTAGIPPVLADELSELKSQLQRMEEQHQQEMAALRKRLDLLETQEHTRLAAKTPSASKDLTEKVAALEEDTGYLKDSQEALAARLKQQLDMHLYATLAFDKFQERHASFNTQKVELLASSYLTDQLKGFMELEIENLATTEAGSRVGEISLEQGWVEYALNDYLKPRAGVILLPFGRFNLEHFDPFQELTGKPLSMQRVVPSEWADVGVGLTGTAPLGQLMGGRWLEDLTANYQGFVVNGLTNEVTDTGLRDARSAFGSDNNSNKALAGRLEISPFAGQAVSFSGYFGTYDNNGHSINGVDTDVKLTKGPLELVGEYALFHLQEGGFEADGTTAVPTTLRGGYVQASYHFWPSWLDGTFLRGHFQNPKLAAIVRYDQARISDDGDAGSGPNIEDGWTLGFNYRPVSTWVYKLEYQFHRSKTEALNRGDSDGFVASVAAAF